MSQPCVLSLLSARFQPGWDDLIAGFDLGLIGPEELHAWLGSRPGLGPAWAALASVAADGCRAELWNAAAAATGKVPRPGTTRWSQAQDRWRVALLLDALDRAAGAADLARLIEEVYDAVGCPEDMLGLWSRGADSRSDRDAVLTFIRRREPALGA
jgi:hypothetical protein